jgi:predicted nucleic acid-binding Zn ribbon protein
MRRRRYNRGRWRIERERHRLSNEEPAAGGNEVPLAEVVAGLLRKLGAAEHLWLREVEAKWTDLAGAAVAAHTRPGRYERDTLLVFVDSSVWLSELVRYGQNELLNKVRKRFPAQPLRSIRFQLDPEGPRRPSRSGPRTPTGSPPAEAS